MINNVTTENLIFNVDPLLDPISLQPIWNETQKSPLINAGHPDTNNNGIPWFLDPDDQNEDGTKLDIGAVQSMQHGANVHKIRNSKYKQRGYYAWISFPFVDKLYKGLINTSSGSFNVNNLFYNVQYYQHNSFFMCYNYDAIIKWINNEGSGEINNWDLSTNIEHLIDSRQGYKLKFLHPRHEQIIIETSGFLAGHQNNRYERITLKAVDTDKRYREVWVGNFRRGSHLPLVLLSEIADYLIEIKTHSWSMNRETINDPWIYSSANPRINFGEAISLKFVGSVDKSFTLVSIAASELYTHPKTSYFTYIEESDYIPFFVFLSDDMISENGCEIGVFINDVCFGAEVIQGEIVQINAYIKDLDIDFDNALIEFRIHDYSSRSADRIINEFLVFDDSSMSFQSRSLDLNQNRLFYKVSFNNSQILNEGEVEAVYYETYLAGNFPNPFNPSTTISFSIRNAENVVLNVYNARGQLVKTLIDGNVEFIAGRHNVIWEGIDSHGRTVGSGIYFYRLQAGKFTSTRKMLLLK